MEEKKANIEEKETTMEELEELMRLHNDMRELGIEVQRWLQ